jgi:hypothetical protein
LGLHRKTTGCRNRRTRLRSRRPRSGPATSCLQCAPRNAALRCKDPGIHATNRVITAGPYPTIKNGQSKRRKERSVADAQQDRPVAPSWSPLAASRFLVPPGARTLGSFRKTSGIQLAASVSRTSLGGLLWVDPSGKRRTGNRLNVGGTASP